MTQCTTCGGTYAATQSDGTRYFHACPPAPGGPLLPPVPMAQARNENAPDAATQSALVAAYVAAHPSASIAVATKTLDTAIVAAGKGTTLTIDAGQVQPSAN